jgi:hypothetical protein
MKMMLEELNQLVRAVLTESKKYGGEEPDYASWSQERAEKQFRFIKKKYGGRWEEMLKAFSWASDPEAALSTLEKKATGKWPREK